MVCCLTNTGRFNLNQRESVSTTLSGLRNDMKKKKCSACRKIKWAPLIRKRTYTGKNVPTGEVKSDTEICKRCHENANLLILGKWSIRYRIEYVIMRLTTKHDPK